MQKYVNSNLIRFEYVNFCILHQIFVLVCNYKVDRQINIAVLEFFASILFFFAFQISFSVGLSLSAVCLHVVEENIPNFFSENNGKELYMISRCMVVGKKQGLTYG